MPNHRILDLLFRTLVRHTLRETVPNLRRYDRAGIQRQVIDS